MSLPSLAASAFQVMGPVKMFITGMSSFPAATSMPWSLSTLSIRADWSLVTRSCQHMMFETAKPLRPVRPTSALRSLRVLEVLSEHPLDRRRSRPPSGP